MAIPSVVTLVFRLKSVLILLTQTNRQLALNAAVEKHANGVRIAQKTFDAGGLLDRAFTRVFLWD